jgi:hypothetical protein
MVLYVLGGRIFFLDPYPILMESCDAGGWERAVQRKVASAATPVLTHSFGQQPSHFYIPLYALPTSQFDHETIRSYRKCREIRKVTEKLRARQRVRDIYWLKWK